MQVTGLVIASPNGVSAWRGCPGLHSSADCNTGGGRELPSPFWGLCLASNHGKFRRNVPRRGQLRPRGKRREKAPCSFSSPAYPAKLTSGQPVPSMSGLMSPRAAPESIRLRFFTCLGCPSCLEVRTSDSLNGYRRFYVTSNHHQEPAMIERLERFHSPFIFRGTGKIGGAWTTPHGTLTRFMNRKFEMSVESWTVFRLPAS
jgi:hypothetical protein